MTALTITRAGPLVTIQDAGRPGMLRHGISASGAMDLAAYRQIAPQGYPAIEFTQAGLDFTLTDGPMKIACAGGAFFVHRNGEAGAWPGIIDLAPGDSVSIKPSPWGNYGYLGFDRLMDLAPVLGSFSTNTIAGLGGWQGRALVAGDRLAFRQETVPMPKTLIPQEPEHGAIRVTWGLHAELFPARVRARFLAEAFAISNRLDRMGVRLADGAGVFAGEPSLSLVSDAVISGDVQILGDGTPIVLMRDHQPTGGYPRIASVISADLDRFAQMRPGSMVTFQSVTPQRARDLLLTGSLDRR